MKITSNPVQNIKNRMRLTIQNKKLLAQIQNFNQHIDKIQNFDDSMLQLNPHPFPQLQKQINQQQKTIKKLRLKLQGYKMQRTKDNVEYITHEQDQLKMIKQQRQQLMNERDLMAARKTQKINILQENDPYQQYGVKFNQNLMEVVHLNRQHASKITQIQRQIRKHHLILEAKKHVKINSKVMTEQQCSQLDKKISQKKQQKISLQKQWKIHFDTLDSQNFSLQHKLSLKKQTILQLQNQQKIYLIRTSSLTQPQQIIQNKKKLSLAKISPKLRQQMILLRQAQQQKKNKMPKTNQKQLKAQFAKNMNKPKQKQPVVVVPINIKEDQMIIEITHDDKNISQKLEKAQSKKTKTDQSHNTEMSFQTKKKKIGEGQSNKDEESVSNFSLKKRGENSVTQKDNQTNPQVGKQQQNIKKKVTKKKGPTILKLREVAIQTSTQLKHWKQQQKHH